MSHPVQLESRPLFKKHGDGSIVSLIFTWYNKPKKRL